MMNAQKSRIARHICVMMLLWAAAGAIYFLLDNSAWILPAAAAVSLLYLFSILRPERFRAAADLAFRYRWALALLFFAACVALQLSGSSIGIFNVYLPTRISGAKSTLFGLPRAIRSDEWAVQTPTFFSQKYNGFALYSDRMSLSPTNMVMDYYAPVRDITVIGKPLSWGYLLLGNSFGLSWYWCSQFVLLFMLSLEMFLVLTENDRSLSALGALMITLSPAVQWWFLPHMPVVILYVEGLFVIGYHFFTAENDRRRALLAAASVIAAVGFALSIFPSFQVPCFYLSAALLAAALYRDRKEITFTRGKWFMAAIPAFVTGFIMLYFFVSSREAIETVLHSVYPGQRMCTGKTARFSELFFDLSSLTLPYRDVTFLNNCEVSDYIHFAPFFALLAPRMFVRLKKDGKSTAVGAVMLSGAVLTAFYMVCGISPWLADLTLLRFCNRMNGVYGWIAAIYTVWGLGVFLRYPDILKKWQKIVYPAVYLLVCLLLADDNTMSYLGSLWPVEGGGIYVAVLETAVLSSVLFFALFSERKLMCALLSAIMLFCGGTVNPIEQGCTAFTDHPLYTEIYGIKASDPDALWLNCSDNFPISNYLLGSGVRLLDATNFYYDKEKWTIIDPDGRYTEFTNRYSNQAAGLTGDENTVKLLWPDHIRFLITPETVKELGIRYILTDQDYSELLSAHAIPYQVKEAQDNYRIIALRY